MAKRVYLLDSQGSRVSFWHDLPLQPDSYSRDTFNVGIEIPLHTLSKMEVDLEEPHNPIR